MKDALQLKMVEIPTTRPRRSPGACRGAAPQAATTAGALQWLALWDQRAERGSIGHRAGAEPLLRLLVDLVQFAAGILIRGSVPLVGSA